MPRALAGPLEEPPSPAPRPDRQISRCHPPAACAGEARPPLPGSPVLCAHTGGGGGDMRRHFFPEDAYLGGMAYLRSISLSAISSPRFMNLVIMLKRPSKAAGDETTAMDDKVKSS